MISKPNAEVDRLRAELAEERAANERLTEQLSLSVPEAYEDDAAIDDILIRWAADMAHATEFTIHGHPNPQSINAYSYTVQVAYRDVDRWAVVRHGWCLDADGNWDYESRPSEREEEWLLLHRFSLPEAMYLARKAAPLVSVNGMTGKQCHEWEQAREAERAGGAS